MALEGQAIAALGAVLLVGGAEATVTAAAIVTTFFVDTIGGAVTTSPRGAGEGRRADPAQVAAAIGPAFLVFAVGDANAFAAIAIEAIFTETAPAAATVDTAFLARAVGNAVGALRVGFGAGAGNGLFVTGATRLEVVADILDTTGQFQEGGLSIRGGLSQAHGEGDVGGSLAAFDALQDALAAALSHAFSLLAREAVWTEAAETTTAVVAAFLTPAVRGTTGAEVINHGTRTLHHFLDAPRCPTVAVVENALHQVLQLVLPLGHGAGKAGVDTGIGGHGAATLHAFVALLASIAQVDALSHLAEVARLAVAATIAAAIVTASLAFATAGVFARNCFPRGEVCGPIRTDVSGHAGVAQSITAPHIRTAEVGGDITNWFAHGCALSVAIEVLAEGLIGGAGEFQPIGAVRGAGSEGPVVNTEALSRDALRDRQAFTPLTHGSFRADYRLTIASAIGFAGLDAAVDAGL